MKEKIFTNCYLVKVDNQGTLKEVCLAMKKRGFGVGLWNGAGGKPNPGESVEAAAIREAQEEFGVVVKMLEKRGEIVFVLVEEDQHIIMHAFLTTDWENEPTETEEMSPKWFNIQDVPFDQMWASDREWLSLIFSGKKIIAKYSYNHEGGQVQTREVQEVANFS